MPSRRRVVLVMAGLYDNPPLQPVPGEVVLRRYALAAIVKVRHPRDYASLTELAGQ